MTATTIKSQSAVRAAFWDNHPQYAVEWRRGKRQNQYRTDIRCAFVDFVDSLHRNGEISDRLAQGVTL